MILAYISSTVLVLTAGRLFDLFGRKTAFVGAFAIFGLAPPVPSPPPSALGLMTTLQAGAPYWQAGSPAEGRSISERDTDTLPTTTEPTKRRP